MIRKCDEGDYENIIKIWKSAFGDSEQSITAFLEMFSDYVYICDSGAIMTLLPVTLGNMSGDYVYAVAVDEKKRGLGLGKAMIEYAKDNMKDFLVLVPADEGLFEYYRKLGFADNAYIETHEKVEKDIKITAKEYCRLRDNYFGGKSYIKWSEEDLSKIASLYGAEFFETENGRGILMTVNSRVIEYLGKKQSSGKKLFSMIYPQKYRGSYFNIAID